METWRLHLLAGTFLVAGSLAVLSYAPETFLPTTASVSLLQRFLETSKLGSSSLSSLGVPGWKLEPPSTGSLGVGAPGQITNVSSKLSQVAGDQSVGTSGKAQLLLGSSSRSSHTNTQLDSKQKGEPTVSSAADAADGVNKTVGSSSAGAASDFSEDSPEMRPSDDIPGSRLKPGEEVKAFRKRWECLMSRGAAHWALNPHPRELPWPRTRFLGPCGDRKGYAGAWSNLDVTNGNFTEDNWPVAESLKYVWEARRGSEEVCGGPAPSFLGFDGQRFCSGLQKTKGSLFIVGDSLSDNFFHSVLSQLELVGVPTVGRTPSVECRQFGVDVYLANPETAPSTRLLCTNYFICGKHWGQGALLMHFARSLHLGKLYPNSSAQEQLFGSLLDVPELAWGREAKRYKGSVILLNRGAHFVPSGEGFEAQLNYTLRELRKLLPEALIVFRSTPAGHPNCSLHERPLEMPLNITEWPYNWDKFEEQNRFAKRMVESVGGVFFDVQPMTSLRPDWHVLGARGDCLHHCRPGPVDDWVKVFARMLEELL